MNAGSMKWLNFLLTLIAVCAIYYFLHDSLPGNFRIPLIIVLAGIAFYSLLVVFRKETQEKNTDKNSKN